MNSASNPTEAGPSEAVHHCAAHPATESELACGKCGTFICPKCMVSTPVGARCRSCARLRRPAQYTVGPGLAARLAGAAIGVGMVVGAVWGLLIPQVAYLGFFMLFLAMAAGYGMAAVIERAGRYKRGPVLQGAAVAGIIVAYAVRSMIVYGVPLMPGDLWSLLFAGIASVVAWNRLR